MSDRSGGVACYLEVSAPGDKITPLNRYPGAACMTDTDTGPAPPFPGPRHATRVHHSRIRSTFRSAPPPNLNPPSDKPRPLARDP